MSNVPHFQIPRRSHRPRGFNAIKVSDEVKAQRAAMLEAKRLADEAAEAKAQTANAMAALEAEGNKKSDMSRQLAEAKQREEEIAEAMRNAAAIIDPTRTKAARAGK